MKILHIDSSITGEHSVSRQLTASVVAKFTAADPSAEIVRRDLAADPLAHLDLPALGAAESAAILDEFFTADVVVIGAPMYNFTLPTQLKAWIDRILIAGKTFAYTAEGPKGLVSGKRVIVAIARGGFYGPGAALEHLETYLRDVFGFIGLTPEFVVAEGIAVGPEQRTIALGQADASIRALAA
ncbi:MAG: FMN-dependent NADH-azoreductase [Sphingobium sp.]